MLRNERGYITLVIAIFVLFIAFFLMPRNFPEEEEDVVTDLPTSTASGSCVESADGPSVNLTKIGQDGGPDGSGEQKSFKLIRKGVKLAKFIPERSLRDADCGGIDVFLDSSDCHVQKSSLTVGDAVVYYTKRSAEVDFITGGREELLKRGIVLAVQMKNGSPEDFTESSGGQNVTYNLVDVYQEVGYPALDDRIFCSGGATNGSTLVDKGIAVNVPTQTNSIDKQELQLEWFLFTRQFEIVGGVGQVHEAHCKPAIYLYPEGKSLVNVKVNTKGLLTYVDPPYPQGGWNVVAYPDGRIQDLRFKIYDYLYYESKIPDKLIERPTQGWVVRSDELESLYQVILPKLGLNGAQVKDFTEYWRKSLPNSHFYFVGVLNQENVNSFEPLDITPKPDSVNRVRVYFEPLDSFKDVETPVLAEPQMSGFRVVEWGGMVKRDKDHPFTCSQ